MKTCPACHRSYSDDGISFCLDDGTQLTDDAALTEPAATIKIPAARLTNQAPTEVLSGEPPPPRSPQTTQRYVSPAVVVHPDRKQNAFPWILGAALVIGLSAIAVAWIVTRSAAPTVSTEKSQAEPGIMRTDNTSDPGYGDPAIDQSVERSEGVPLTPPDRDAPVADGIGKGSGPGPTRIPTTVPTSESTPLPTPARPRAPISGGVVNGRAISKPAPAYPAMARAVRASGTVTVQVTIDESGKVISAQAVSGHPLLRQSAVQAARQARFTPTLLSGQPVKVTGILTYNFVVP